MTRIVGEARRVRAFRSRTVGDRTEINTRRRGVDAPMETELCVRVRPAESTSRPVRQCVARSLRQLFRSRHIPHFLCDSKLGHLVRMAQSAFGSALATKRDWPESKEKSSTVVGGSGQALFSHERQVAPRFPRCGHSRRTSHLSFSRRCGRVGSCPKPPPCPVCVNTHARCRRLPAAHNRTSPFRRRFPVDLQRGFTGTAQVTRELRTAACNRFTSTSA